MLRILLLEDSLLDTELIQAHLIEGGIDCELVQVEASADFQRALEQDSFDLILSDYSLPAFDGISALKMAQAIRPDVPFIFVSATLGEELAIETLKSGATDYVLKQRLERLAPSVKRALRETMERVKRQQAEMALRELAGELERRVVERTTELAKANESLREEIAERKRVEESLRRSESTIRSYFELPLIGIAITSPDKGWIEVNAKLCDILGYDRHELIQMTWVDVTYPGDLDADLEYFNRILAGEGDGYSMDKRFVRKDGRVIYASTSIRCVRKADASIDYFVTLVQDITERKQAEERLRLLESVAVNAKDAIVITEAEPICEPGPRIIYVNDAFTRMTGYSSEEVVGKTPRILRGPKTERAQLDKLRTALENSQPTVVELIDYRKDGSEFWVEISVVPVANAEGWYTHWVSIQRDITERKRAEQESAELIREQAARLEAEIQERKSAFLAEASTVLASSLDYETTLASVAQLAVPFIADWCAVDILEDNQDIRRVAIAHGDPVKVELAWELERRYPRNFYATVGLPTVLRSGQSAIATEISDSALQAVAQDAEHLQILRELGLKSCIVVPMLARGRALGAITLATAESGRRYSSDEVFLVEDVARRAALAVDNARLYRKKQEAQRIAEETAERTANLQALTAALSEALTPVQVGEVVVNRGLAALKASAGFIALLRDRDTLELVRFLGYPQGMIEDGSRFPLTTPVPIADAVRMQQPVLLESREVWAQKYPHIATQYANTQHHAWAAIPLIVEGRTVGGIGFSFPTPQTFSEEDCAFMLAMGQQCAQALERARAYAAERQARADAEAANRMKDEFLATLSHELRTPLNAMLGWTQLLRTRKLEETKMARALETIDRNTKSLCALIEDILDVSRIIRGKLQISVLPCDLVGVIEAAIETVRPAAEAKAIQIEYFCDSSIGLVLGDMNRLQQVVWNLLSNAVKFTPKGGHVEIRFSR
jgi:PAS domain S-box-containing protein